MTGLGLCWQHGLAADGVVSGSCLRSGYADGEQVSPAQIQFRAGHALRVCCRAGIIPAKLNRVSRAQRTAPRSDSKNEVTARLRYRNGWDNIRFAQDGHVQSQFFGAFCHALRRGRTGDFGKGALGA